ncbi:hypothetical protein AUJ46_01490 [Candidatus Peregrinibacteria bacterium CG1_02_54_53]|nr:MAG: hypothetical protein AUJ46_01490 [Candidatus Peregrinibacteria bacterium CG1_02_54_53]
MRMIKHDNTGPTRGLTPFGSLFDEAFWDPFGFFGTHLAPRSIPAMNIAETPKELSISINVPGFEAKDIVVDTHNNVLSISGKAEQEQEENDKEWVCRESSFNAFQRQVRLPDYADGSRAECKVKNGVLSITIPKREEAAKKTLKVEEA